MIASHDSFTFLPAVNRTLNRFSKWWRCQNTTITQQYTDGVRFFDVRVFRDKGWWRAVHGKANLDKRWISLKGVFNEFKDYPGVKLRLILEKGGKSDQELFKSQLDKYKTDQLVCAYIKQPWTRIFYDNKYIIREYNFEDWSFSNILKNIFGGSPIRDWAKRHNPKITHEMIIDPTTIYMMDYVSESIKGFKNN